VFPKKITLYPAYASGSYFTNQDLSLEVGLTYVKVSPFTTYVLMACAIRGAL